MSELKIFSGSASQNLTASIVGYLKMSAGNCVKKIFSDDEIWVKFKENIRGDDIFLVQSTQPPAENFLELLIMIDAARRASAGRITAVIPYFGYARQDRKDQPRVAITAKLACNLLTAAGASRILGLDFHFRQLPGFFDIPVDHLFISKTYYGLINKRFSGEMKNVAFASADVNGAQGSKKYAQKFGLPLIIVDKDRLGHNQSDVNAIIGDPQGKIILIIDDICDTGGSLIHATDALLLKDAREVHCLVTHAVLSGDAVQNLRQSAIKSVIVSNSIHRENLPEKFCIEDCGPLLGEAIQRIHNNDSVSFLFEE